MREIFVEIVGGLMVFLAILDVFMTVLYARAATGPLSHRLASWSWALVRRISRHLGRWKDDFLSFFGPMYLVCQIAIWAGLLLLGFTLITWPNLGSGVQAKQGATETDFMTAFYYAGGSMTTVGSGDLSPTSAFFKFLSVFDSLLGISVLTLTFTYVIQIYAALLSRNAFALSLHQASSGTSNAAVILAGLGPADDFSHGENSLSTMATEITNAYEAEHFYPLLIFFRFREPYYAMARAGLIVMDLLALVEAALDQEKHGWLMRTASVRQISEGKTQVLVEFASTYLPGGIPNENQKNEPDESTRQQWKDRYLAARAYLRDCGISVAPDENAGVQKYLELRRQWNPLILAFAKYMEHSAEEIDPATSEPSARPHRREVPTPPLSQLG